MSAPHATLPPAMLTRSKQPDFTLGEVIEAALGFQRLGLNGLAAELYKTWIAWHDQDPLVHIALFNLGVALREVGDVAGSLNAFVDAARVAPQFGPAQINLGRAFEDAGQGARAVMQWRGFLDATKAVTPERTRERLMTLQNLGRVHENAELSHEAETYLREAIELRPDQPEAAQHWIALRQRQCKWPTLDGGEFVTRRQLVDAMSPMSLAVHSDDPMFQLAKAARYNRSLVGAPSEPPFRAAPRARANGAARIRVGYVSSDLRAHAVGFALSEALELHDKSRFETFGYYCGSPAEADPVQRRMRAALDGWRDVSALDDRAAAQAIFDDEIDILVDVNGYTKHARARIFAWRPAPVIVNWCGYPGTTGSPYHHYAIADRWIAPPGAERHFSERVLRIPCNQPIDRKRPREATPSRAEVGLPDAKFVFASFNGMQKLTPRVFALWMDILRQTPDSALWLLTGGDAVDARLRGMAQAAGVAPERLIFAPKAGNARHLARLGVADLFLDTFPYGAHSTAADALTANLPILTRPGRGFASRFCASVVAAAGLEELICRSDDEYVRRAVGFAQRPESLLYYRKRLERTREASVLHDIPGLVRGLESCFEQMQSEREQGLTPTPDLSNLDIYYEIGAELDATICDGVDDATYEALWREKLRLWNAHRPIAFDKRMWIATAEAQQ